MADVRVDAALPPVQGRAFRNAAIALTVVALLCASPFGTVVCVIGMISIIGIPISLFILAMPTIAFVVASAYLLWRYVPGLAAHGKAPAAAFACSLVTIVPLLHNAEAGARVAALREGDTARGQAPPVWTAGTLGLVQEERLGVVCDSMCVHILMSGQAEAVIVSALPPRATDPVLSAPAYRYAIETGPPCAPATRRGAGLGVSPRLMAEGDPATIAGRYARLTKSGRCITVRSAKIADADRVLMVAREDQFGSIRTVSPIPAEIAVTRAAVYAGLPKAQVAPLWRRTNVGWQPLRAVLATELKVSSGLSNASTGLMRRRAGDPRPEIRTLRDLLEASGFDLPKRLV